ncbi:transcriptional regulator, Crp/Fnr family [Rhodomicrobium vannielii ATCC 17100]|jgi:CRP/FNR family transcriptional regulator, cyclic AMP receptor protein|uniref:Transcriptional regulator, Crp/Fnr family n=2 Tax=Rhodomicrobium vannielii TaxID=1069 RepID=E3I207_RHOVT|nr:Crp/Fnr family transcriptional regulator [Rhodomicrobium vannielii]ADP71308.1 transcriptional regulator, Crp/Fnr family [Rhodomicrobium vannielii ATCC 17100]
MEKYSIFAGWLSAGIPPGADFSLHLRALEEEGGANPNFFHGLDEDDIAALFAVSCVKAFAPGEAVFRQGEAHEGIFVILCGKIRVYYLGPSGRELTLAYWSAGNFVGGPHIFGECQHMWSGQAEEAAEVLVVPGTGMRALIEQRPRLAVALVEAMAHKGKCFSSLIQMLGTRSAAERLAQLLLLMAEMGGQRIGDRIIINRTLTQDELARLVGATRQWISATLERFREKGLIEVAPDRIVILDEARLRCSR